MSLADRLNALAARIGAMFKAVHNRLDTLENRSGGSALPQMQNGRVNIFDLGVGKSSLPDDGGTGNRKMFFIRYPKPYDKPPILHAIMSRDAGPAYIMMVVHKSEEEAKTGFWVSTNYWSYVCVVQWTAYAAE